MDEEPNEHELEERLYAMIHHVDQTQANVNTAIQNNIISILENAPRSSIRRYWHTSSDQPAPYQKINISKDDAPIPQQSTTSNLKTINSKPKEEKCETPKISEVDLSLFQSPPQNIIKTIEILDPDNTHSVILETSDEDEVIEVELPPKPTITIESSDEDEVCIVSRKIFPAKDKNQPNTTAENITSLNVEREISASPVPSVVSSVSDDFIRSDCIALNISSKCPDNHSFDFSLHGSDLLGQVTPSKKKRKKKTKETVTSTPIIATSVKPSNAISEACFATPKSKVKNKKQKTKSYAVTEKSVPSADIYDSDSNQSIIDVNKKRAYAVTEKSLPNADVYESDSSQPENNLGKTKTTQDENIIDSSDSNVSDKPEEVISRNGPQLNKTVTSVVDLTDSDNYITLDSSDITESIVMANVSGFKESEDYGDEPILQSDAPKLGSTKVPQILLDNLDFDNLKGNDKVCKRRRYSLTTLRAEMEKFYNESWGGEDFNHREIQKYMSRDKSLWVIDPKDRMPTLTKRKVTCNYCNRAGHRDDMCRMKPPVCYMCGSTGHYEPRCPSKICVNCGSPNHMYSTMCRNCSTWARVTCAECGQPGHPPSHCPDLWRRYHNTIDNNMPLVESRQLKKGSQLYCSGCTRRGHLVHTCRHSLPFSGLPINSPYVALYRPVYLPTQEPVRNRRFQDDTITSTPFRDRNKRQSKSPTVHENHVNKKRNLSISDVDISEKSKNDNRQRKISQGKSQPEDKTPKANQGTPKQPIVEKTPDFIPISSNNHDKKGQMIQDNEVSDTSDVVTSARIYVTNEIIENLKTEDGETWLKDVMKKCNIAVRSTDVSSFLSVTGKVADQEVFQRELREWSKLGSGGKEITRVDSERGAVHNMPSDNDDSLSHNIPKKKCDALRKLGQALESLKNDLGDPDTIYKELGYLQKNHEQLLKQKVVSPQQVVNNRNNMNRLLRKLNMVLLGQAGLADGPQHLNKLYSLQQRLTNFRNKNISMDLRKEIGQHFHTIFTASPRDDYADLLKKYNISKKSFKKLQVATRKKKKARNRSKSGSQSESVDVAPVQTGNIPNSGPVFNAGVIALKGPVQSSHSTKPPPINLGKLTFYHRRIMNSRPAASALKRTRTELVRKLHVQIASLYRNENMSSKTIKKVKKIQQEAQLFLRNV